MTGIILSGSPYSTYDKDAPRVDPDVFEAGVPVLGICYGLQETTSVFGGKVEACDHREYGFASLDVIKNDKFPHVNKLFEGIEDSMQVS